MAGPLRLFLDANILFSAAHSPHGRSAALFVLARNGSCRLLSSRYAAIEAERNLREKSPGAVKAFAALLAEVVLLPEADAQTLARAAATGLDAADVPILAAALGKGAPLVTGDRRHFGRWMGEELLGVEIWGLAQALERLLL